MQAGEQWADEDCGLEEGGPLDDDTLAAYMEKRYSVVEAAIEAACSRSILDTDPKQYWASGAAADCVLLSQIDYLQIFGRGRPWWHSPGSIDVIKELFGDIIRPIQLDPMLRTGTVVALAKTIYEAGAFDRLPILVDALEDAGCDDVRILSHCRQARWHVRGCWALDLILGKN